MSPSPSKDPNLELDDEDVGKEEESTFTPYKIDKKELKQALSNADATLDEDIQIMNKAMELFLNSRFKECEAILKEKYCKSLYHTLGYGIILSLKAVMTFDRYDLDAANDALKNAVEVASFLRKEHSLVSSFTGFMSSKGSRDLAHFKGMNRVQRHAEVAFAEAYVMKAMLCLITDSNLVAFVREGLNMRQSYLTSKSCYRFLRKVWEEEGGAEGLAKHNVDMMFIDAVQLSIGNVNLILSILPSRILRVFEMMGFSGNREFGMKTLELAACWPERDYENISTVHSRRKKNRRAIDLHLPGQKRGKSFVSARGALCDIFLQLYHICLASMIQLPGCNIPNANLMMKRVLKDHPDSFVHLTIHARLLKAQRKTAEAVELLDRIIKSQTEWRQLVHICYWDKAIGHASLRQWKQAADCFDLLIAESKWSQSIYRYSKAVFLYMEDPQKYKQVISELMADVPKMTKRVAGKSIPFEKYVARKARKFVLQKDRLLLPGYELLFMYDAFDHIPGDQLEFVMKDLDKAIADLDDQEKEYKKKNPSSEDAIPYETYYDDVCLTRFLKGLVSREMNFPTCDTLISENAFAKLERKPEQRESLQYAIRQMEYLVLQADSISLDHWILPFSRYEMGQLYCRLGDYAKARREYNAALNGGYADDEAGHQKRKASMENSLHLRVHNALGKLDMIESFTGVSSSDVRVEEAAEEDEDSD